MASADWKAAVSRLRAIKSRLESTDEARSIQRARDEVLQRYQPLFAPEAVEYLDQDDFLSFLYFENNHHWTSLYRQKKFLVNEFEQVKRTLALIVNEGRPLTERLNLAFQDPAYSVKGLGRSLVTPILLVVYPDKYGVWNGKSDRGINELGIYPAFERGSGFGDRYSIFNAALLRLRDELGIDLWTLDTLWHILLSLDEPAGETKPTIESNAAQLSFGIEHQLQDFLVGNWDKLELGAEWVVLEEDGEQVGSEYNTGEIGRIDLLAHARDGAGWLVIELKRDQTADQTLGQVKRYMGWVKENLADEDTPVKGLIICQEETPKLRYALVTENDVDLLLYEVSFRLKEPDKK